jgi:hypothetical protein
MSVREKTQRHLNRLAAAAAVASTVASAEACNKESGTQPTGVSFQIGDLSKLTTTGSGVEEVTATPTGYRVVVEVKYPPYVNLSLPVSCAGTSDAGAEDSVQLGLDTTEDAGPLKPTLSEY